MRIYDYTNFDTCYFGTNFNNGIGEAFSIVERTLANEPSQNKGNSVIIAIVSCGFYNGKLNFFRKKFEKFNNTLKENNCHLLLVRGTDNDPTLFDKGKLETSNIKLLESNCLVKLKTHDVLCISGSISLDRSWKKSHEKEFGEQLYWENECTNFDETDLENTIRENNITVVVTLDSPTFLPPSIKEFSKNKWLNEDENLKSDCINNRLKMDTIYKHFIKQQKLPSYWLANGLKNTFINKINDIVFINKYNTLEMLTEKIEKKTSDELCNQLRANFNPDPRWRELNFVNIEADAPQLDYDHEVVVDDENPYDHEIVEDLEGENIAYRIPF